MSGTYSEWAGCSFIVGEVSGGVYEVTGADGAGRRVQAKAVDPDSLLAECCRGAGKIAKQIAKRGANGC